MKLYEIDKAIEDIILNSVDEETGEIVDEEMFAKLDELNLAREQKFDNILKLYKSIKATIDAEENEKKIFEQKIEANKNRLENLKGFLNFALKGEKHKSDFGSIYYTTTQSTVIADDLDINTLPEEYKKITVEAKKAELKKAILEEGKKFDGVTIQENTSMVVRLPKAKNEEK